MGLILDKGLSEKVHKLAQNRNISDEELVEEALIIYKEYIKLLDEFKMWDEISDKDFREFENTLWK